MMFAVSILPLAVLLAEQAPRVFCGSITASGPAVLSNGTSTAGSGWIRSPYGVSPQEDTRRFYTLDYTKSTTRTRARDPKSPSADTRREPRFISFETKDNNIEVEIDFAIPFLSIPIQKSMNGMMGSVLKGTPLLNVNLGAVVLAGVLTAGGALLGAAARTFTSNSSLLTDWGLPLTRAGHIHRAESRTGPDVHGEAQEAGFLLSLLGSLDRTMGQHHIDTVACVQRTVCWYVKEATVAVGEGRAGAVDTIVEGLSRADWMERFMAGTAIEQAIRVGREQMSCEKFFSSCAVSSFVEKIVRLARRKR